MKFISIGEDGEEHYDMIDMEREAQRAVRRITDPPEIVKEYKNAVRAYNIFMKDYPWMSTEDIMKDNCRFEDMLKDKKRNVSLNMNWEDLWVSMQYPYLWALST